VDLAKVVDSVESGIRAACEKGQTDKVIVFDGSYGHITCNAPMADLLRSSAPAEAGRTSGSRAGCWACWPGGRASGLCLGDCSIYR